MRSRRIWVAGALVAALAMVSGLAACGDDDDTTSNESSDGGASAGDDSLGPLDEASGDPVVIGYVNDGTTGGVDHSDDTVVAEATVEYINQHLGGIAGRPIELVECTTENDPAKATDCGNRFVEEDVVAVVTGTSGLGDLVWTPIHEAGIPYLSVGIGGPEPQADGESTFFYGNALGETLAFPVTVAEREGHERMTVLGYDVPGVTALFPLLQAAGDSAGVEVEPVWIAPGTADMLPQVTAGLEADPDIFHIIGDPVFCKTALTALYEAGWDGDIVVGSTCVSAAAYEGLPPEILENLSVSSSVVLGDASDADWQLYEAIMDAYAERPPEVSGVRGWTFVSFMALRDALDEIDAADVTPEAITAALNAMPESPLPLGGGITYVCDGSVFPAAPSVCTNGVLETSLDEDFNFGDYEIVDVTPQVEGIATFLTGG